jgi:hypothetical protein
MPKYSRTAKYEDLRSRLQSDSESEVRTNDLSQYEQRLNHIAPNAFTAPEKQTRAADQDVMPARRSAVYNDPIEPVSTPSQAPASQPMQNPDHSNSYLNNNANYTSAFNNEYLNEYIREVKQYNIDQGNAISANTDLNILKALKGETPTPPAQPKTPVRPYPNEQDYMRVPSARMEEISVPASKQESAVRPAIPADTADISFFNNRPAKKESRPAVMERQEVRRPAAPVLDFLDDDDETAEQEAPLSDTRTMSKEDIAAEVQRLINGAQQKRETQDRRTRRKKAEEFEDTSEYDDRSTRQQLLNETTQMRAQLDDYEDNLNDVSDKMNKTNQILNIVLIILIIALTLVLGVVIFWVVTSKGVIGG